MNKHKYILAVLTTMIVASSFGIVMLISSARESGDPVQARELPNWTAHVLDIGQGDSIFIELADGTQILVDGGADDAVLAELGAVMAPWDRTIDIIVATHPHVDHIGGLIEVMDRYEVGTVVANEIPYMSEANNAFWNAVVKEGAKIFEPNELDRLVDGEVVIELIYPSPEIIVEGIDNVNENSIVLRIDDGAHSMLLTGDVGEIVEAKLLQDNLVHDVDVLKVGHHGSKFSSSREFLERVAPEYAVISLGLDNEYHHPHPTALKRLEFIGAEVYRTDIDGMITIESYDDRLEVTSEFESSSILDYWMR